MFTAILSFIPKQIWIYGSIVVITLVSLWYYGNIQYRAGYNKANSEFKDAAQIALNNDLGKVREELRVAIAQRDKALRINAETATEVKNNADRSRELEKEIEDLKSTNVDCDRLDDSEYKLLNKIISQTPSE